MRIKHIAISLIFLALFRLYANTETIPGQTDYNLSDIGLKSNKEKIDYYTHKGDFFLSKYDYTSAIESYHKAIAIKEKNPEVLLKLGETYRLADMKEEAIGFYERAIKSRCSDIRVFLGMGMVFESKLLYEKADYYFVKALEKEKNNPAAIYESADIYEKKGRYSESIEMYKKLLSVLPGDAIKDKIAGLYILLNDYVEARKYLSQSSESSVLKSYLGLYSGSDVSEADSGSGTDNEIFLKGLALLRKGNSSRAGNNFETLANAKENSLAKKLAMVLCAKDR